MFSARSAKRSRASSIFHRTPFTSNDGDARGHCCQGGRRRCQRESICRHWWELAFRCLPPRHDGELPDTGPPSSLPFPRSDAEILRLSTDEIQNRTRLLENELKVRVCWTLFVPLTCSDHALLRLGTRWLRGRPIDLEKRAQQTGPRA